MARYVASYVDFIAELPEDVVDTIIGYLRTSKRPDTTINRCCLVSRTWKRRIERSHIWSILAKKKGQHLTYVDSGEAGNSSTRTPRYRYYQIQRRLKNLGEELEEEMLILDQSQQRESEAEISGDVPRGVPNLWYGDGIIATGQ